MSDWTETFEVTYHIEEMEVNGSWRITGHGPMPHNSNDTAQTFSLKVWARYVDYLNARELERDGNPEKKFRLIEWHTKRSKVIVYV